MKTNVFFALFTLIISTTILHAQTTWQPKGSYVTYGTPGKGIWHIGANEDDPSNTAQRLALPLARLYMAEVHPFKWHESIPEEVIWHIRGTKDALNNELKKFDGDEKASWIWENAPNLPIITFIDLPPNGFGRINVFQSDQIIASFRCVSSDKVSVGSNTIKYSQPRARNYKILKKENVHPSKEFGGLPMKWAMCIDKTRGIFLHGRNISENSHGCIGISVPAVTWLYNKATIGSNVTVNIVK